jgi:uncharacterized phage-associated protein
MKLQKLIYFAHGWHLALRNGPLIDEHIEAWEWGPVVPTVYHEFKRWGRTAIEDKAIRWDGTQYLLSDHDPLNLLDRIWYVYGKYTGGQLSAMTHQKGTPWHQILEQSGGRIVRGTDIPDPIIADYFRARLAPPAATAT